MNAQDQREMDRLRAELRLLRSERDVARVEVRRLRNSIRRRPRFKLPVEGVLNVGWKDGRES